MDQSNEKSKGRNKKREKRERTSGVSRRGRTLNHQEKTSALSYGFTSLSGMDFPPLGSEVADYKPDEPKVKAVSKLDIDENIKEFFLSRPSFSEHLKAQEKNSVRYAAGLLIHLQNKVMLSQSIFVRALAAAWARHDHALAEALLSDRKHYGIVEVSKALKMLDSSRRIRCQHKCLKRLQKNKNVGIHVTKKINTVISNLSSIKPEAGTASGALSRHIRRWARTFTTEELQTQTLAQSLTKAWMEVADMCHLHPQQDFNLPWFLPYCCGDPPPENSIVWQCQQLTSATVNDLVIKWDIPINRAIRFKDSLNEKAKARIASYTVKLDSILWHYEDLQCGAVDKIIHDRLCAGETVALPTGKLLERLLTIKLLRQKLCLDNVPFFETLKQIADRKLSQTSLSLDAPVVVMGDRSGSMEIAVQTSAIIAAMLSSVTKTKLVFFDNENMEAPFFPHNTQQALDLAVSIATGGGTSPASALYPFYWRKEVIKTFIIVTDEEENDTFRHFYFDELFQKYHKEVFPAQLVFVSFLEKQNSYGDMVLKLEDRGFKPIQIKLDKTRLDLSKLDNLLGMLALRTAAFNQQLSALEALIKDSDVKTVFSKVSESLM